MHYVLIVQYICQYAAFHREYLFLVGNEAYIVRNLCSGLPVVGAVHFDHNQQENRRRAFL